MTCLVRDISSSDNDDDDDDDDHYYYYCNEIDVMVYFKPGESMRMMYCSQKKGI